MIRAVILITVLSVLFFLLDLLDMLTHLYCSAICFGIVDKTVNIILFSYRLLGNYKLSRESCLGRDALYEHYVSFCQCRDLPPGNKSTLTLVFTSIYVFGIALCLDWLALIIVWI